MYIVFTQPVWTSNNNNLSGDGDRRLGNKTCEQLGLAFVKHNNVEYFLFLLNGLQTLAAARCSFCWHSACCGVCVHVHCSERLFRNKLSCAHVRRTIKSERHLQSCNSLIYFTTPQMYKIQAATSVSVKRSSHLKRPHETGYKRVWSTYSDKNAFKLRPVNILPKKLLFSFI